MRPDAASGAFFYAVHRVRITVIAASSVNVFFAVDGAAVEGGGAFDAFVLFSFPTFDPANPTAAPLALRSDTNSLKPGDASSAAVVVPCAPGTNDGFVVVTSSVAGQRFAYTITGNEVAGVTICSTRTRTAWRTAATTA